MGCLVLDKNTAVQLKDLTSCGLNFGVLSGVHFILIFVSSSGEPSFN